MPVGAFLCAMIFALGIGSLVGAVILRAAISLYNSLAGGPDSDGSVPEPTLGEAVGIVFATYLVNALVGFGLGYVLADAGIVGPGDELKLQLMTLPVSIIMMAAMLSAMLPTTFGRALLVAICQIIVSLLIVGVIVAVVIAVSA